MSGHRPSDTFVFNDKIDAEYIYSMYENDYPYIESMFKVVLDHFDEDLAAIQKHYEQENIEMLRRSVHKVRPSFGFAGMPGVQEKCREFENKCQAARTISELESHFPAFIKSLKEAGTLIVDEYKKLRSFNGACS